MLATSPAFALEANVSAISYPNGYFETHIQVFTVADSGHLVALKFDGTNWTWMDHGLPAGSNGFRNVQAITYQDESGNRRIEVFGIDDGQTLRRRYFDGVAWRWANQGGLPVGVFAQSAITYLSAAGNRRIFYFAEYAGPNPWGSSVSGLRYNHFNGSSWEWVQVGFPPGVPTGSELLQADAITYVDEQGNRRIDVFCSILNPSWTTSTLYSYSWNGSSWGWTNLGGTTNVQPKAVTYTEPSGTRRIKIFSLSESSDEAVLRVRSWTGGGPGVGGWTNLSRPITEPNSDWRSHDPIAFVDSGGNRRMQDFVSWDGAIHSRQWDGSSWLGWFSHGIPPGGDAIGPSAVTFTTPTGARQTHLFVQCGNRLNLCDDVYNGTYWQWQNRGHP
jgi:hypothetical protein